ncbi:predicted protein [Lichtheimia corymbifera JMRC:FSU:9682]|uniref:Uncharacterized protein n=1 Tax=Lichtheimia corymbifera JMRC:FSU:9682 TaxID=1263082 RepID=A0A068S8M2_9FUNG|nr:predicted protein [Lichtheimia corymbifera JMRC:FSU:9682]
MTNGYYWNIVWDGCSPVDMAVSKDDMMLTSMIIDVLTTTRAVFGHSQRFTWNIWPGSLIELCRTRALWHQTIRFYSRCMIQVQQLNTVWNALIICTQSLIHASLYMSNTLPHIRIEYHIFQTLLK